VSGSEPVEIHSGVEGYVGSHLIPGASLASRRVDGHAVDVESGHGLADAPVQGAQRVLAGFEIIDRRHASSIAEVGAEGEQAGPLTRVPG
jgi:hypothetical protein